MNTNIIFTRTRYCESLRSKNIYILFNTVPCHIVFDLKTEKLHHHFEVAHILSMTTVDHMFKKLNYRTKLQNEK